MDEARIAELLQPFLTWPLSDRQLESISMYIDILLKWNQKTNLTAVRRPEEIVTRHFGESLFTAQRILPHVGAGAHTRPAEQSSATQTMVSGSTPDEAQAANAVLVVVDVGSGAGFPGFPIKIWAPEVRLCLIESNYKKATFLKEIVRALGLEDVEVFTGRAENFPAASADIVTLRAVEHFQDILPVAARLVKPEGRLALLIGNSQTEVARAALGDLQWQAPVSVPVSHNRVVLVGKIQAQT
ncbi:MAG TPA: 16S rRNA (guanine(527)-N(7))-methyltransferase RsmG [Terriglobales bacterium]